MKDSVKDSRSCGEIRGLLASYVDGLCSETARKQVEAHLETCPECLNLVRRRKLTAFAGEQLEQKALAEVRELQDRSFRQGALYGLALAVQAVLGFVILWFGGGVLVWVWAAAALVLILRLNRKQRPWKPMETAEKLALGLLAIVTAACFLCLFYTHTGMISRLERLRIPAAGFSSSPLPGGFLRQSGPVVKGPADITGHIRGLRQMFGLNYSIFFFLLLLLSAWLLARLIRRSFRSAPALCAILAGQLLCLHYGAALRVMELDPPVRQPVLFHRQLAEGAVLCGLCLLAGLRAFLQSRHFEQPAK